MALKNIILISCLVYGISAHFQASQYIPPAAGVLTKGQVYSQVAPATYQNSRTGSIGAHPNLGAAGQVYSPISYQTSRVGAFGGKQYLAAYNSLPVSSGQAAYAAPGLNAVPSGHAVYGVPAAAAVSPVSRVVYTNTATRPVSGYGSSKVGYHGASHAAYVSPLGRQQLQQSAQVLAQPSYRTSAQVASGQKFHGNCKVIHCPAVQSPVWATDGAQCFQFSNQCTMAKANCVRSGNNLSRLSEITHQQCRHLQSHFRFERH